MVSQKDQKRIERTNTLLMLSGNAARIGKDVPQSEISADLDLLHRYESTLHRIAENECNGHPKTVIEHRKNPNGTISTYQYSVKDEKWAARDAKKETSIQGKVRAIAEKYGISVSFNGDPRGGAIRFTLPDGRSNGWDGTTWGIYW